MYVHVHVFDGSKLTAFAGVFVVFVAGVIRVVVRGMLLDQPHNVSYEHSMLCVFLRRRLVLYVADVYANRRVIKHSAPVSLKDVICCVRARETLCVLMTIMRCVRVVPHTEFIIAINLSGN